MNALQEARDYLSAYQHRINQDSFRGDLEARTRYEDCAYKEGMLNAAIAQAEELKRIADMLSIHLNDYDPNGNEAQGRSLEDPYACPVRSLGRAGVGY